MINELSLQRFRGFEDLQVGNLRRINLFTGKNNVGKTSILESLFYLLGKEEDVNGSTGIFRCKLDFEDAFENDWSWLFFNRDVKKATYLSAKTEDGTLSVSRFVFFESQRNIDEELDLKDGIRHFVFSKVDRVAGFVISDYKNQEVFCENISLEKTAPEMDSKLFNRASQRKLGEQRVTDVMKLLEPRLQALRYLQLSDIPMVYADVGLDYRIPIIQFGQGFNRVFNLACRLVVSDAKILLIDEIESGIHTSVLRTVWRGLIELARAEDVQIFATTHSYECIRAALDAYGNDEEFDFALHRLQRNREDKIEAVTFDRETIETAIKQEWELR